MCSNHIGDTKLFIMKYHFFWGGIYSNWAKSPFTHVVDEEKVNFNCGEQYMMYCKAILSNDYESAEKILKESNPRFQKQLGREVKNFNSKLWDKHKYMIMYVGLKSKFEQNSQMKEQLMKEDCDLFVEASPHDRIWGIGYDEKNALVNRDNWGENLLGRIITDIRNSFLK